MPIARAHINQLIQDSQDYGSDDEHMISRIFFDLDVLGVSHTGLYVNIKQTIGTLFETGSIEVSKPVGYNGPWDHQAFSAFAEEYFRSLVGKGGSVLSITGGSQIRMRNNTFVQPTIFEFQVNADGGHW